MAVRSSMTNLIVRVQDLINDPAVSGADGTQFTAQKIQDALDRFVWRYSVSPMSYEITYPAGQMSYLNYLAPEGLGDWEEDVLLQNSSYTTLTPASSDYITGHWVLSTTIAPPVYLTGKSYDVYAAAAYLLTQWAAKYTLHFDASGNGASFSRSQMVTQLRAQAKEYLARKRVRPLKMKRNDLGGDSELHEHWRFRVSA